MPKSPAPATAESKPARARRINAFTTATVVSFSFTLLAGSIAVLTNIVPPLRALTLGDRIDLGAMLFLAPVLALVLGIMFEATRMAISREALPEPRRQQAVRNWQPGRREG